MGLVFLILLSGCENILNVELQPLNPEIVVTCVFTENSPWQVIIQRTIGPKDDPVLPSAIEHANVSISGSDGSHIDLTHKGGGFYFGNQSLPQSDIVYSLKVKALGYTTVEASDQIPTELSVQGVLQQNRQRMVITINDHGGINNYYAISLFLPNQIIKGDFRVLNAELHGQIRQLSVEDPFAPSVYQPYINLALIHDKPFDGKPYQLVLSKLSTEYPSTYVRSVSQSYYDYYVSKIVQINSGDLPFSEPAPIKSNIQGGQGIFAGYRLHVDGILTPQSLKKQLIGIYHLKETQIYPQEPNTAMIDIKFSLHEDHSVSGYLRHSLQSDSTAEISLDGGYTITDIGLNKYYVQLHHSSDTFFKNTELVIERRLLENNLRLIAHQQEEKGRSFRTITRIFERDDTNSQ
ncbi:MAG: DUF4249 family protein [Bacteroidetes bacterium]|nr:DUF4249 family protein [Bacteroidota bacterium]